MSNLNPHSRALLEKLNLASEKLNIESKDSKSLMKKKNVHNTAELKRFLIKKKSSASVQKENFNLFPVKNSSKHIKNIQSKNSKELQRNELKNIKNLENYTEIPSAFSNNKVVERANEQPVSSFNKSNNVLLDKSSELCDNCAPPEVNSKKGTINNEYTAPTIGAYLEAQENNDCNLTIKNAQGSFLDHSDVRTPTSASDNKKLIFPTFNVNELLLASMGAQEDTPHNFSCSGSNSSTSTNSEVFLQEKEVPKSVTKSIEEETFLQGFVQEPISSLHEAYNNTTLVTDFSTVDDGEDIQSSYKNLQGVADSSSGYKNDYFIYTSEENQSDSTVYHNFSGEFKKGKEPFELSTHSSLENLQLTSSTTKENFVSHDKNDSHTFRSEETLKNFNNNQNSIPLGDSVEELQHNSATYKTLLDDINNFPEAKLVDTYKDSSVNFQSSSDFITSEKLVYNKGSSKLILDDIDVTIKDMQNSKTVEDLMSSSKTASILKPSPNVATSETEPIETTTCQVSETVNTFEKPDCKTTIRNIDTFTELRYNNFSSENSLELHPLLYDSQSELRVSPAKELYNKPEKTIPSAETPTAGCMTSDSRVPVAVSELLQKCDDAVLSAEGFTRPSNGGIVELKTTAAGINNLQYSKVSSTSDKLIINNATYKTTSDEVASDKLLLYNETLKATSFGTNSPSFPTTVELSESPPSITPSDRLQSSFNESLFIDSSQPTLPEVNNKVHEDELFQSLSTSSSPFHTNISSEIPADFNKSQALDNCPLQKPETLILSNKTPMPPPRDPTEADALNTERKCQEKNVSFSTNENKETYDTANKVDEPKGNYEEGEFTLANDNKVYEKHSDFSSEDNILNTFKTPVIKKNNKGLENEFASMSICNKDAAVTPNPLGSIQKLIRVSGHPECTPVRRSARLSQKFQDEQQNF